ncbi:DUF6893 family small protein [Longispora sp. K20-0274]
MMGRVVAGAVLAGVVAAVVLALPDIRRYLRIRRM